MSSSDYAIRIKDIGKQYRIGVEQSAGMYRYKSLGDSLGKFARAPLSTLRSSFLQEPLNDSNSFWALKDVSFDVKKGEVVGIIGRNGAGKSTLLKILSRITRPTTGEIELHGRVGSLLEVGTGFHPELSGRENIFQNGAILGMTRAEVKKKFDEIVAFSEIEKFLDTPVKQYSSGMYTRLAFAVAAHLETEVLIVDEVLAVGDASFQKRCLNKMESVGASGRTVIFVSHSMSTIGRLCKNAVFLRNGILEYTGNVSRAVKMYLSEGGRAAAEVNWDDPNRAPGDSVARLRAVRVIGHGNGVSEQVCINDPFKIEIEYEQLIGSLAKPLAVSMHLVNDAGITVFASNDFENEHWYRSPRQVGRVRATCEVPADLLAEGSYTVLAAVCTYDPNVVHAIDRDAIGFHAFEDASRVGSRREFAGDWPGVIRPRLKWAAARIES